jgi:3-oxoacyl-[acyl-carrier protein] reductase
MRLKDKVAIVTGGANGIGKAYCLGFVREGAKVVIADNDGKSAIATVQEIELSGGKALAVKTDVSEVKSTLEMADKTSKTFGKIDILVNNAAFYMRPSLTMAPFDQLDVKEWDRVMAVNLKGPFLCSRAVLPFMRNQKSGKIINITSDTFFMGRIHMSHYVASKGGVIGLTRVLANELGQYNINVNCVAPGSTFSENSNDLEGLERRKQVLPLRALRRVEYPDDLVGTVIFLASQESDFITGQTLTVNGGMTMT